MPKLNIGALPSTLKPGEIKLVSCRPFEKQSKTNLCIYGSVISNDETSHMTLDDFETSDWSLGKMHRKL